MNKQKRLTALLLTVLMILPMISTLIVPISAAPSLIFSEDFEKFADKIGTLLTKEDGFGVQMPYSTTPVKENGNTYLKVEFASYVNGVKNPTDTVHYVREGGVYKLVDAGTEGAYTTDRASYGLISGSDDNLDKNIIPKHGPLGTKNNNECVILSVDYYLSEDAKGTIQSQGYSYTYGDDQKSASWLSLFRIEAATGKLLTDNGTRNDDVRLTKGDWSTVTMVIDTVNGYANLFVDYALAVENLNFNKKLLNFNEDSFIIAKIPRTTVNGQIAADSLAGHFAVDDVRVYAVQLGDSSIYTSFDQQNSDGQRLTHVQLKDAEGNPIKLLPHTNFYLIPMSGETISPIYFDLNSYNDVITEKSEASLRLVEPGGLRFVSRLNSTRYEQLLSLEAFGAIQDVNFGTLIAPELYVREAGDFTIDALRALDRGNVNYIMVEGTYGKWYQDQPYTFAGSIVDILPSHYDDKFVAVGYVEIRLNDHSVHYIYGSYNLNDGISMTEISKTTLESEASKELSKNEINYLKQYQITPIDIGMAHISDIYIIKNQLFFKTSDRFDNVSMSISYAGNHGWRIKAARPNGIGVESYGAAQALADYMGEEQPADALPVTFSNNDGKVTIKAPDGSYVEIWYKIDILIRFYSPAGKLVSSIQEVHVFSNSIGFRGGLISGEGVYGGGERFDNVNKANTGVMNLYTSDGWNNSSTSYLAIPLFVTTRGAGIYVNRYEKMSAEFVLQSMSFWEVKVESHVMDIYVFTPGDMQQVLTSYTELTGHAEKPEEWAHGVMLCRYAYDLTTYDQDRTDKPTNNDGAPSGRSVVTLVSNMINAGMKPSSVVMEAWNYGSVSFNESAAEELRKAAAWLDERDIKCMLYMRVAGSINKSAVGFKDEYLLHAWVTNNEGTTYTSRIPDTVAKSGNPDVGSAANEYIDITNPEALQWYFDVYWGKLLDLGVDGVKIDFCETMPDEFYTYGSTVVDYDYYDSTKIVSGTEHHAYSTYFITAFYKRMNELKVEKGIDDGFVVLSRGGGIGSQRNPYLWAGDQVRAFTKLDDQIKAVINCGLSGVPFMTYDMAGYRYGFGDVVDGESDGTKYADEGSLEYESAVFARAIAFTVFTSNIQTHGTVRNAYELTEDTQQIYRNFTGLHEDLMPYITKTVDIACTTGVPSVRQPVLNFQNDRTTYNLETEFMLGDALLISPVLTEDPGEVEVYLPKDTTWTNLLTGEVVEGGTYCKVTVNLGQIPVFLNNSSEDAQSVKAIFDASENWAAIQSWTPSGQ